MTVNAMTWQSTLPALSIFQCQCVIIANLHSFWCFYFFLSEKEYQFIHTSIPFPFKFKQKAAHIERISLSRNSKNFRHKQDANSNKLQIKIQQITKFMQINSIASPGTKKMCQVFIIQTLEMKHNQKIISKHSNYLAIAAWILF